MKRITYMIVLFGLVGAMWLVVGSQIGGQVQSPCTLGSPKFWSIDANGDGGLDISDPIYILEFLFTSGPKPNICLADCPQCDNAAKLDGLDASAFALSNHNHDDRYSLLTHTHEGHDIRAGAGSGLDADLLDGMNSSEFAKEADLSALRSRVDALDEKIKLCCPEPPGPLGGLIIWESKHIVVSSGNTWVVQGPGILHGVYVSPQARFNLYDGPEMGMVNRDLAQLEAIPIFYELNVEFNEVLWIQGFGGGNATFLYRLKTQ